MMRIILLFGYCFHLVLFIFIFVLYVFIGVVTNAVVVVHCFNAVNVVKNNDEFFCLCYKVQKKTEWLCEWIFKNNLIIFIIDNIILELLTIGFEKKLNNNLKDHNYICLIIYIISFFILCLLNRLLSNKTKKKLQI